MADSTEKFVGKYASEAYDFVVLAGLFQRSLYGLLLLQIGWIGSLYCLLKLPVGDPRKLSLPGFHLYPTRAFSWQVDVWWVWMFGAFLILAYWLLRVRGFLLWRITARAATLLVFTPLALMLVVLLTAVDLLLMLAVFVLRDSWRTGRLKEKERQRRLIAIRNQAPEITDDAAEAKLKAELNKEFPKAEDPLFLAAMNMSSSKAEPYFSRVAVNLLHFTFLDRAARIAISPFGEFPNRQEPSASWNGARIFGVAMERLNREGPPANWPQARFTCFRSHEIRRRSEARWLRRLLGMDALIWGNYVKGDTDRLWVRFEVATAGGVPKERETTRDEDHTYRSGFFKRDVESTIHSVTLVADDSFGSLVTLCACLLQVLQYRDERWNYGWRKKISSSSLGFLIFRMPDKLSTERSRYATRIVRFLATEVVPYRKPKSTVGAILNSADAQLAEIISSWVGSLFDKYGSSLDRDVDLEAKPFLIELRRLLEFCTEVSETKPVHFYRLGFILCLLGEVDDSVKRLRRAGELDVRQLRTETIMASVLADMDLGDVTLKRGLDLRLARARWAVHMAAVIAIGGDEGKEKVRKELPKLRSILHTEDPPDPSELVIQQLLQT